MDIQISDANNISKDILNLSFNEKEPSAIQNVIVLESDINNEAGCNHRRAGSTGTISTGTGSGESFTTTDDECDIDGHNKQQECPIKNHHYHNTSPQLNSTTDTTIISPSNSNSDDAHSYIDLDAELEHFDVDKLRYELRKVRESLLLKDEEVARLSKIRADVASELEDLTASLFQEAHNMVRVANEKQAAAEKAAHESQLKVDLLSAEVSALKTLVLTSTPSAPNKHLHPQIDQQRSHKHRRCSSTSSHFNLKCGGDCSPSDRKVPFESPARQSHSAGTGTAHNSRGEVALDVDPVLYEEFVAWKRNVSFGRGDSAFMRRIYSEDIDHCLEFVNEELSAKVVEAVENGSILIEVVGDKSKTIFPKKCALMDVQRHCHYRMNTCANAEADTWHFISTNCRNRIIAVCDFRNYLKYIERGLVKSTVLDIYWEIVKLRKDMMLARLGLTPNLSSH